MGNILNFFKPNLSEDSKKRIIDEIQQENNMLGSMVRKYVQYHHEGNKKGIKILEKSFPYLKSAKYLV